MYKLQVYKLYGDEGELCLFQRLFSDEDSLQNKLSVMSADIANAGQLDGEEDDSPGFFSRAYSFMSRLWLTLVRVIYKQLM